MVSEAKDVIYIDIDDEITTIIDKLRTADARIVALVLPKRATVFQSSVNMKLLKKTASESKKRLVLITSETNLLPLAGSIGLFVAKNLQSKPEIPISPDMTPADNAIDTIEGPEANDTAEDFDQHAAAEQPVGELAGLSEETKKAKPELTPMAIPRAEDQDEPIELDNTPVTDTDQKTNDTKKINDKNLKVPNFNKFRKRLIITVIVLILLIVGWILANDILPKATITINSQTSSINSNLTVTLSTAANSLNQSSLTVPTHAQQVQKTTSQQIAATGQLNNGTSATGTVNMTAQVCSFPAHAPSSVPSGIGVSWSGLTFIAQQSTTFSKSGTIDSSGCVDFPAINATSITAQSPGDTYNTGSTSVSFTVSGYSNISATGSASGGTNNIVQVVTQSDINNATSKLTAPDTSSIKTELQNDLSQAGYHPIPATFSVGTPANTSSANVGDQASTVTVTQTTSYTMFGVHESDLQVLLDSYINSQINTTKQSIIDDGISQASFSVLNQSATADQVSLQAIGSVGLHIDVTNLKKQVAGQKTGEVDSLISSDPGVTSVKVKLSPFWVSSVPIKTSKITIVLQSATHANNT